MKGDNARSMSLDVLASVTMMFIRSSFHFPKSHSRRVTFMWKLWLLVLSSQLDKSWCFPRHLERSDVTPIVIKGKINQANNILVNSSVEYLLEYSDPQLVTDTQPACVVVECNQATREYPVLIVVRQSKGVLSWQLPLLVPTKNDRTEYHRTSRILCPNHNYKELIRSDSPKSTQSSSKFVDRDVFISISSASIPNLNVSVLVKVQRDFIVGPLQNRSLIISPSEPRYYEFQWSDTDKIKSVLLEVKAKDEICMVVSIQKISCPVSDLERTVQFEGFRQTVNQLGGITLNKDHFPDGFYVVFVVKGDDYDCSGEENNVISRNKEIELFFTPSIGYQEYIVASISTLFLFFSVYALSIIVSVGYFLKNRNGPEVVLDNTVESTNCTGDSTPASTSKNIFSTNGRRASDDSSLDETDIDALADIEHDKDVVRSKRMLYVCDLARKSPQILRKKSLLYFWNLLTVATFYVLPVVQLVISNQMNLIQTGNQDLCYYNFLCAHPLGFVSDFNHIYSNVGYVALGLLFVLLVYRRDRMHCSAVATHRALEKDYGIPPHFGLFYAMGAALIMEGVLSGCYHVCPNHSNFQFDTSFMYVIAMLCMLKIYHTRHPDVNASAYATFGMLALVILVGMAGILSGTREFWAAFTVLHIIVCIWLSGKVYYVGRLQFGFRMFPRAYHVIREELLPQPFAYLKPKYPSRMVLLILGNICNWLLAAAVWIYHLDNSFGSYLLAIFMANLLLYTLFYIVMKLCHHEKILLQPLTYMVLAVLCWSASLYFFLNKSTSWAVTPANSRDYNQHCKVLDFYDNHDIWHFLSAFSMFFSFMVLLTLDDDLVHVPRTRIPVF